MGNFQTARGMTTLEYAASIAATWVWAPAIFVASAIACQYGLEGLAWFAIPNVLTLVLFGFVASRAIKYGPTASDVVCTYPAQEKLHKIISLLLLVCSTFVQLLGVYYLAEAWFGWPRWLSGVAVLVFALALVWKGGLKACIRTDVMKYFVMVGIGVGLIFREPSFTPVVPQYDSLGLALTFGLPTAIGLLAAPYVDSTFWQRSYSLYRGEEMKVFGLAAALFALVPLSFGFIGLGHEAGWNIQNAFADPVGKVLLLVAVLAALVSTIDSNLCAVGAYFNHRAAVVGFSLIVFGLFLLLPGLTIVDMFLFYGTLRTVAAVPTVLTVFGKQDPKRLFMATATAAVVCPVGFAAMKFLGYGEWAVLFTVLAVLIPFAGWKK